MATNPQMYTAEQNDDGTWRVARPDGSVAGTGMTEQEATRLAYGYNVAIGYLKPAALDGGDAQA